jgi:hypothetical protein
MVAENSRVWRDLGSFEQISSMSGMTHVEHPVGFVDDQQSQPLSMILPRPNRSISRPAWRSARRRPFSSAFHLVAHLHAADQQAMESL